MSAPVGQPINYPTDDPTLAVVWWESMRLRDGDRLERWAERLAVQARADRDALPAAPRA